MIRIKRSDFNCKTFVIVINYSLIAYAVQKFDSEKQEKIILIQYLFIAHFYLITNN